MTRGPSLRALGTVAALALPLVLVASPSPALAAPAGGGFADAYGILADATLLAGNVPVVIGPLAPVSSSCPPGGSETDQLIGVPASPVVAAGVLDTGAATDCAGLAARASAQTAGAVVLEAAAPLTIRTDAITSTADASCAASPAGSTQILNLSVGGTVVPLPAEIPPNFDLLSEVFGPLGIRVILNEQHPAASGRGIVVNGLHLIASGTGALPVGGAVLRGDVIISHAQAGVVCPGGPGSDLAGLPAPDITFDKTASAQRIAPGDTVTYTATLTNSSQTPCEVLKAIDHIASVFTLVSSSGPLGSELEDPAPVRSDGGVDAVLRPSDVVLAPGASVVQTFTVTANDDAAPGVYHDTLEIYCGANGNFVSGPLAPVEIARAVVVAAEVPFVAPVISSAPEQLPRTGAAPALAVGATLALLATAGLRRRRVTT